MKTLPLTAIEGDWIIRVVWIQRDLYYAMASTKQTGTGGLIYFNVRGRTPEEALLKAIDTIHNDEVLI